MEIRKVLLEKYNIPVPRYTSYPPANHFTEDFTGDDYTHLLDVSNSGSPHNIAVYIHIPFCRKICHYCGCNSCPAGNGGTVLPYIQALKKEMKQVMGYIDKNRPVSQIHYGGGTPNSIDIRFIREINDYLRSEFRFINDPEIAIECNPAYLDFDYADGLLDAGFNRFSLGIQDFNENVLSLVNRDPALIHPSEMLSHLRKRNKEIKLNLDFIYGLPGQTVESFTETVREAAEIRPDRLVTFSYAHVPWLKKHQSILERKGLPLPEEKMNMFLSSSRLLSEKGYMPVGLDHFVLPGDDLYNALKEHKLHRNFMGYCTRRTTGQVYAFGVTGISQLEKGYSQNRKDIAGYIKDVEAGFLPVEKGCLLTREQMITREVITEIMCNKRIDLSETAGKEGISVNELKKILGFREEKFDDLVNDGIVSLHNDLVEVTESGSLFIRNVAALFDRDYQEKKQTYSKIV